MNFEKNFLNSENHAVCQFKYRRRTYHITLAYSPISLTGVAFINFVSIFRCSSSAHNRVYVRRVVINNCWEVTHEFVCLLFLQSHFRFIDNNKQTHRQSIHKKQKSTHRETDTFLHLQEFSLSNITVVSSTFTTELSPHISSLRSATFSSRIQYYGLF